MHYYQFNIGDYVSHTRHLSLMEDLAFRRLLDFCYLHEEPVSGSAEEVARRLGMRDHVAEVDAVLREFFQLDDDGRWHNGRVERELEAFSEKREKAVEAGKASAKARANAQRKRSGRSTDVQRTLNVGSTDVQPTSTQEPLDTNPPKEREGESAREPVVEKQGGGYVRGEANIVALLARERILDLAAASRGNLAREAARAGVTEPMCQQFLASMRSRGKSDEAAKGLLVAQLRKPSEFVLWHKAETLTTSKP